MEIILIEQRAVIDCLTNTSKYYEREDADEWTKGIHYGLLHGVDNILDNVKPVEAIPKDQYEARLKADMVAMLEDLRLRADETQGHEYNSDFWDGFFTYDDIIRAEINALKGE